jgi:alpha-1,3/alpha-1,6-mannosyltransferase
MGRPSSSSAPAQAPVEPLHVVFVHLDLGIGGAEQLVIQLAKASLDLGYRVDIVTTRCDQDHCFAAVKKPNGVLSNDVCIYGRWIPTNIFGIATAFMSTLRMIYITYKITQLQRHKSVDVVVVDVLPTSLPLLLSWMSTAGILFYCHFPDKLLLRNNRGGILKKWYRKLLDAVEESTMGLADTLVVNSQFTLSQVKEHFPVLYSRRNKRQHQQQHQQQQRQQHQILQPIEVLYPALDTSNMVQANNRDKTKLSPIVSLNRFERKKNIGLLIRAYAYMTEQIKIKENENSLLPPLVIAGGYDTQNAENVEYRGELGALAKELGVPVDFRLDISDEERATLFQTALCVVYTPDREHFGIVPLEAGFAGTPCLAVNSGGPIETVRDDETGFLRDPTPEAFGDALFVLIEDPQKATRMGQVGRNHVETIFGTKRFEKEWKVLIEETKALSLTRNGTTSNDTNKSGNRDFQTRFVLWANTSIYMIELMTAFLFVILITWFLRQIGILQPSQSIVGAVRTGLLGDEL